MLDTLFHRFLIDNTYNCVSYCATENFNIKMIALIVFNILFSYLLILKRSLVGLDDHYPNLKLNMHTLSPISCKAGF